jgi:HEAT repeat protein
MEELVDGLVLVLREEPDDWIAWKLLDSIVWRRDGGFERLFRAALDSTSVNLRASAVHRYQIEQDPAAIAGLEALWERDLPGWLRPRLIGALANQGSIAHLADFMRLTRDDDADLRTPAIEALGTLARDESIPILARVARDGSAPDRASALEALGAFPDSDEALQAVLGATRSADGTVRWMAVRSLGRFQQPEAGARLIALLQDPPDHDLRGALASALESSTHADATAALVRLLHSPDVAPDSWIATSAIVALHNRDDPEALSGLRELQTPRIAGTYDPLDALVDYLSRDRSTEDTTAMIRSDRDNGFPDPREPRVWHVAPPEPWDTIRCWAGPDRPGDPEIETRLPAGTPAQIVDYFERPRVTWVRLQGGQADGCWVPFDQLQRGDAPPAPASWPRLRPRIEIDLDEEDVRSPLAAHLREAGLLTVFEPGIEVEGAALVVDLTDQDQVRAALSLASPARTRLARALRALFSQGLDDGQTGPDPDTDEPSR